VLPRFGFGSLGSAFVGFADFWLGSAPSRRSEALKPASQSEPLGNLQKDDLVYCCTSNFFKYALLQRYLFMFLEYVAQQLSMQVIWF